MSFSLSFDAELPKRDEGTATAPPPGRGAGAVPMGPRSSIFSLSGNNSRPSSSNSKSAFCLGRSGRRGRSSRRCTLCSGLLSRRRRGSLGLRFHNIDTALEIRAVLNDNTSGFDVAHQPRILADLNLVAGLDISLYG